MRLLLRCHPGVSERLVDRVKLCVVLKLRRTVAAAGGLGQLWVGPRGALTEIWERLVRNVLAVEEVECQRLPVPRRSGGLKAAVLVILAGVSSQDERHKAIQPFGNSNEKWYEKWSEISAVFRSPPQVSM